MVPLWRMIMLIIIRVIVFWIAEIFWESLRTRSIGHISSHHSLVLAIKNGFCQWSFWLLRRIRAISITSMTSRKARYYEGILFVGHSRSFKVTGKARCFASEAENIVHRDFTFWWSCKMASYWVRHSKFSFSYPSIELNKALADIMTLSPSINQFWSVVCIWSCL